MAAAAGSAWAAPARARHAAVVGREPLVGKLLHLADRREDVRVEDFLAIGPVKALDEGVLIGLARLDVAERDPVHRAPRREGLGGELGTVVEPEGLGPAVKQAHLFEDAHHASRRDRRADLDRERFPVRLVEDVECAEAASAVERILHEIEGPDPVEGGGRQERLAQARRDAPLRPPRQIEPQRAVHPMDPFVVPRVPEEPGPVEARVPSGRAVADGVVSAAGRAGGARWGGDGGGVGHRRAARSLGLLESSSDRTRRLPLLGNRSESKARPIADS